MALPGHNDKAGKASPVRVVSLVAIVEIAQNNLSVDLVDVLKPGCFDAFASVEFIEDAENTYRNFLRPVLALSKEACSSHALALVGPGLEV